MTIGQTTSHKLKMLTIAQREQIIREVADPLPGSIAYTNERPLNVPGKYAGWRLIDFVCDYHPHVPRSEWERICQAGLIHDRAGEMKATERLQAGHQLKRLIPETVEPAVNVNLKIVAWEKSFVVFEKPAPLPVHPCGRFNKNSLAKILELAFPEEKLRPVHRLDANTTGLILFSGSREFSKNLQQQFEQGLVKKTYYCKVHGQPAWNNHFCDCAISRQTETLGTRIIDRHKGQSAQTQFNVLKRNADGTTILEAIPITGRTNQIRVHLWHLGYPIVGDPVYLPDRQRGSFQTLPADCDPMALHACQLTIRHPVNGEWVSFHASEPGWFCAGSSGKN